MDNRHVDDKFEFMMRRLEKLDIELAEARESVRAMRATLRSSRKPTPLTDRLAAAARPMPPATGIANAVEHIPRRSLAHGYDDDPSLGPDGGRRESQEEAGYGS